ncbi:hypothetical protein IB227_17890 [Stenotrophomonas sp. STM01]|uniref:T6SS effector BTH_I2691 family protein n=1 Tax=Stenotrophomonas sp. STM01 TaxID=2769278 RepID=UPI00178712CF|nr:T6SS effector BTH_I2691 family protein [Stenotrophomonas sp. STM01]MBD9537725.1 hypothetical protein [Stenotrophomonas sp. STM01]
MFDGNQPIMTYGPRAIQAASAASRCGQGGCPSCVKTGLPVLVVRPGVVAKPFMSNIQGHLSPLLRGIGLPRLKYLDYAARTLREGYLYAFYEKAHTPEIKAQGGWQVNLVDEGGYLTPVPLSPIPLVGVGEVPRFSCERTAGYAAAMLFVIPDAKNTGRVWVAFSENPWAPKVLERYAKDEGLRNRRMTCINAPAASCPASLPFTAGSAEQLIYDYSYTTVALAGDAGPYPRWSPRMASGLSMELKLPGTAPPRMRSEVAQDVVVAAREILSRGRNQYSESDLRMVMVDDVVGIAHETAVLRTTYFKSASDYVLGRADGNAEKADWMLKSALSIEGLMGSLRQAGQRKQQEYDEAGYSRYHNTSMMHDVFVQLQQGKQLPAEAEFVPNRQVHVAAGGPLASGYSVPDYSVPGRVVLPSPVNQAEEQCEKLRKKLRGRGAKADYRSFLDAYETHARRDAEGILAMEGDHFDCLDCAPRKFLFEYDFDEDDKLSGFFYACTAARVLHGGHITGNTAQEQGEAGAGNLGKGKGGEWYARYLGDDPTLKENILLRALLGNTSQGFKEWLDKRDGHFGMMGNVLDNVEELSRNPAAAGWVRFGGKHSNALRMLASGYVSGLLPIVGGAACLLQLAGRMTPVALARMTSLISLVSNAGARHAGATLVGVTMPLYKALRIWRRMMINTQDAAIAAGRVTAAKGTAVVNFSSMLKSIGATAAADTLVEVYMWVDKAPREMEAWAQANALKSVALTGAIRQGSRAAQYAIRLMPGVMSGAWTQATRHINGATLAQLTGTSGKVLANGTAIMAGGAGVLSVLSIMKNYEQFSKGNETERAEATIGILTGSLAFAGAALTLQEQIYKAKSYDLRAANMKMLAGRLVATASFVDAVVSAVKFFQAKSRGDYAASGVLALQAFVLAGAGAAAWAAAVGSSATILGIGMTGWGLILALVGVGLTFVYYYLKNSPLEDWGARSIWGGNSGGGFKGLAEEQLNLNMLQSGAKFEFEDRLFTDMNTPGGKGIFSNITPWMVLKNILGDKDRLKRGGVREGWVRITMPSELKSTIRICIGVYARKNFSRRMVLAGAYLPGDMPLGALMDEYPDVVDIRGEVIDTGVQKDESGAFELVTAYGIPNFRYTDAHAVIWLQEMDEDAGNFAESSFKIRLTDGGDS